MDISALRKTFNDVPLIPLKLSVTVKQNNKLKYTSICKENLPSLKRPKTRLQ